MICIQNLTRYHTEPSNKSQVFYSDTRTRTGGKLTYLLPPRSSALLLLLLVPGVDLNLQQQLFMKPNITLVYRSTATKQIKVKFALEQGHQGTEGEKGCSSTLSLTLALDGGGWLRTRTGSFFASKETRYPLRRRLGVPQDRSGRLRKISRPRGFDPRTVQLVASRYTDRAILAHSNQISRDFNYVTF